MKPYCNFFTKKSFFLLVIAAITTADAHSQQLKLVKDINTTSSSSSSYPFDFNIVKDNLFFIAYDNSGTYGLWLTTGTTAGTVKLTPSTGTLNNIPDIIAYHNKIYFEYDDGVNGNELWNSNGKVAGTKLFKDVNPGSNGSYPQAFTVANDKLFFMGSSPSGDNRLYASDGTTAGTVLVRDAGIELLNGLNDFPVYNNAVYFIGDDGTGSGYGLWKSNGTVAGTNLVYSNTPNGFVPGVTGCNYAIYKNKLYFSASDDTYGSELWVTDGTAGGTHIVVNLSKDDAANDVYGNGSPDYLQVYNGKLFFSATDDKHGTELFKTDGTAGGTHIVKDIVPGTDGSFPNHSIVYNGYLYFFAGGSSAGLFKTDGTASGTVSVKTGLSNAVFSGIFNNELYIVLGSSDDNAVWQTNGTTNGTKQIVLQNTSNPVSSLSHDFKFISFDSSIFLSAENQDITVGDELCKITGAPSLMPLTFTGKANNNIDILSWNNDNNFTETDHFDVQKSNDGITFSNAASLKASGSESYNFTYPSQNNPSGFYRIQLTDKEGNITFSNTIKLQRGISAVLNAFYNTGTKQINIINKNNTSCEWKLFSMNGSVVKDGNSADELIKISASSLASGVYIISCKTAGKSINTKLGIY